MIDQSTYGFSKQDANSLLERIELRDELSPRKTLPARRRAGGARLYRFTLNASLASGTADADILEMDGTDTTIDDDVLDPLGIFASLTSVGAAGLCILQDGKYYVIQAACPA